MVGAVVIVAVFFPLLVWDVVDIDGEFFIVDLTVEILFQFPHLCLALLAVLKFCMNMFMSSSMSIVAMSKTSSLGDCGMNTTSSSSSGCGCGCGGVRGELAVAARNGNGSGSGRVFSYPNPTRGSGLVPVY